MEMYRVSSKQSLLTSVSKFCIRNSSNCTIFFFTMNHCVASIFSFPRIFWISLNNDVSCKKTNFTLHRELFTSVHFNFWIMSILKRFIQCQSLFISRNTYNFSIFWLIACIVCRSDTNFFANFPINSFNQSNLSRASFNSCCHHSPSGNSHLTMDV